MGQAHSRSSSGKQLYLASLRGDTNAARLILNVNPSASCHITIVERNSPLLIAAARGHARLVQAILEAAVLSQGLTRAKQRCINHINGKGQSAIMLACMNGHAQCVEVLVCNGASPLALDNTRHNSALHWAASCCRADCVTRLLGSGAMFQMLSGQLVPIADIPCFDEDNSTMVKFIDRHNGWGLTSLHLAAYKGSTSTVKALLRQGAAVDSRTTAPSVPHCPVMHAVGSTALHLAAAAEDLAIVVVLLEAQASRAAPDMRRAVDAAGHRPLDVAQSSSNPLLQQLLDPAQAIALNPGPRGGLILNPGSSLSRIITREGLRHQIGVGGLAAVGMGGGGLRPSRRGGAAALRNGDQPAHTVMGSLLQRLKLVLSLEAVALQNQLAAAAAASTDGTAAAAAQEDLVSNMLAKRQQAKDQGLLAAEAADDASPADDVIGTTPEAGPAASGAPETAAIESSTGMLPLRSAGPPAGQGEICEYSSSNSSSLPNMSRAGSSGSSSMGDDTQPVLDAKQQQQQQHEKQQQEQLQRLKAAETAAHRGRLQNLEQLLAEVHAMMAVLPPSATPGVTRTASSPAAGAALQQHQDSSSSNDSSSSGGGSSSSSGSRSHRIRSASAVIRGAGERWGFLGSLLGANVAENHHHASSSRVQSSRRHEMAAGHEVVTRAGAASDGAVPASSAADSGSNSNGSVPPLSEEMLNAFITPSTLSSLAAIIKLFVNASPLSGKQQLPAKQQKFGTVDLLSCAGAAGGVDADAGSPAAHARWAEQEHALVMMRSILQTAHTSLKAGQQAASAAASRALLRQRQQEQVVSLLGPDRLVHGHSSRRVLLGGRATEQQGRVRFSGGSTRRDPNGLPGSPPSSSTGLPAVFDISGLGSPGRGSSRRHQRDREHSRSRRDRLRSGEGHDRDAAGEAESLEGAGRRHQHHRHHSSRHRPHRRHRTPVLLGLPDVAEPPPAPPASPRHAALEASSSPARSGGPASSSVAAAVAASDRAATQQQSATAGAGASSSAAQNQQQQHRQRYMQQLAEILRRPSPVAAAGQPDPATACSSGAHQLAAHPGPPAPGGSSRAPGNGNGAASSTDGSRVVVAAAQQSPAEISSSPSEEPDEGGGVSLVEDDVISRHALTSDDDSLCSSSEDAFTCAICMDSTAGLSVSGCSHSLCLQCAYQLSYKAKGLPLCPFCRQPINGFDVKDMTAAPCAAGQC